MYDLRAPLENETSRILCSECKNDDSPVNSTTRFAVARVVAIGKKKSDRFCRKVLKRTHFSPPPLSSEVEVEEER